MARDRRADSSDPGIGYGSGGVAAPAAGLVAARRKNVSTAWISAFFFDKTRKLFSIGYRATDGSLDPNCYDLLASEARLASFIAIAKGDVPSSHWFRLGRALTPVGRGSALISWSGSMFEYLMPALVMRSPANSLLSQTYEQVVLRQIEYGAERGVPWGISESAYNARDIDFTYQYSSFGVPGLGLKRGLSEDLVIAPYATALAAMIDPVGGVAKLRASRAGRRPGERTASTKRSITRAAACRKAQNVAIVRAYMAHHQGMSLVSLANALNDGAMRNRFHAEPIVQATELLLQERTPRDVLVARPRAEEVSAAAHVRELVPPVVRRFTTAARRHAAHATAFQRPLRRDAHGGGLGLQPLARYRHHALARRSHAGLLGNVYFTCATSRPGTSGRPATSRAASKPIPMKLRSSKTTPKSSGATAR